MCGPDFGFLQNLERIRGWEHSAQMTPAERQKQESTANDAKQQTRTLRQRFTIFHRQRAHRVPTIGLPAFIRKSNRGYSVLGSSMAIRTS